MDEPDPPTAILRLRGRRGPVSALVLWPGTPGPARRPVVALGQQGQPETRALCCGTGRVVLALAPGEAGAWDVVCWVAAHAAELGARPGAVLLAGDASAINRLLTRAATEGWPPLAVLPAT
jgi:hypothetical protein